MIPRSFLRAAAMLAAGLIAVLARGAEPAKDEAIALRTGPVPSWVEPLTWTVPAGKPPTGTPAQVLLSDAQDKLTPHGSDYYYHVVIRLLTAEGVRQNAEQSSEFTPEYESITWHTLKLHRNGETLDRLGTAQFKRLQRELGLEAQIVTGQITLATVLEDVRVGDVLELAYTLHNENPLFAGHISARHYLGAAYPIQRERVVAHVSSDAPSVRYSFIVPPGTHDLPDALYRQATLRLAVDDTKDSDGRSLRWEATDLPGIQFEEAMPARVYPYWPTFRISSFKAWAEVVEWAEPLFAFDQKLPEPVAKLAADWKREPDPAKRLAAAVHWVQDDVRYFALALGEHTLRPRPLADVCSTRFGDCKDKSLLLCALLRELGFEAWPALANTYWRDELHELTPNPYAFNHAIVAYRYRDRLRWIDPTLKKQQGPVGEWAVPPYRCALLIRHGESDLTDIDAPPLSAPDTSTIDRITIDPQFGDATLATEVTLSGLQADYFREQLDAVSPDERAKRWLNFIGRFYKQIEEVEPPVVQDDQATNRIVLRSRYRIPGFFQAQHGESMVTTYAYALRAVLDPPESRRRRWPYALAHDRFVRQRIEVDLPFELPIEQLPEAIDSDGLEYRVERGLAGKRFVAQHDLQFKADYVAAERMPKYCDAVDEVLSRLATSLHHKPSETKSSDAKTAPAKPTGGSGS